MSCGTKQKPEGSLYRMKILSIGRYFDHKNVENISYKSNTSLFEYDIVIWDPNFLISEYRGINYSRHKYPLDEFSDFNEETEFIEDVSRRKREMAEILENGKSIIIFTPKPQRFNASSVKDLSAILPIENVQTIDGAGESIDFSGKEPFNKFWVTNKDYLTYRAYFERCKNGEPIFYIKGTKKVLGFHFRLGNGNLIFIPNFLDEGIYNISKKRKNEAINNFIESIKNLIFELNKDADDFKIPNWCSNYSLPGENLNRDKLRRQEAELKEIESKINIQKKLLMELEKHKILFAGDGRDLELEVCKIFRDLGFDVKEGPPGRDDLILKCHDKIAVVEVKGVSKSAAEAHVRQLESWVCDHPQQPQIKPKGILVINTYKNIPLKDRTEKPFPDQMLPFSEKRGHCLITGLQLLGLYFDCMNKPSKKEEMIRLLFDTNGIFREYEDSSKFLEPNNIAQKKMKNCESS
ncbi:MAG: hypothetical protein WAW52_05830 [Methanothrix sp.]